MKQFAFLALLTIMAHAAHAQLQSYWATNGNNMYSTNTGNVGIGVSNPVEKLSIMGNLKLESNNLGSAEVVIAHCNGCYSPWAKTGDLVIRKLKTPTTSPDLILSIPTAVTPQGRSVKIGDEDEPILVVRDDGKVTIGNTPNVSGDYRLYVEKGIIAELVKVALKDKWPDDVFDPFHTKMSLSEVENYVKKEKHLPNVPSEAEVKKEGIDVAKMDATLLRQIEEIYLHLIDLKKENEALKKEISALKKQ
jgi:hypothetical protein